MNITQLRKEIEEENARAQDRLAAIGARLRREKVIPFCDSRRVRFVSGMGGFAFQNEGQGGDKYEDELSMRSDSQWQTLFALLNESGGGIYRDHCIGSGMEDYTPPGFNAGQPKNPWKKPVTPG